MMESASDSLCGTGIEIIFGVQDDFGRTALDDAILKGWDEGVKFLRD
jgi:hypothetical protein